MWKSAFWNINHRKTNLLLVSGLFFRKFNADFPFDDLLKD